jgi:hypothetical protein
MDMRVGQTAASRESGQAPLCETLLVLLRERVATRYYDRPEIIDALARTMVSGSVATN